MTTYRISEAASLLGIIPDAMRRRVGLGRLPAHRDEHGHRRVAGADLAAFASAQIEAETDSSGSSARNRVRGIVTGVIRGSVTAQVEIAAGPHRMMS